MSVRSDRQARLLEELRHNPEPLSARELGDRLGVAPRTIRDYVADLNSKGPRGLIVSDQLGYRLDEQAYRQWRAMRARSREPVDTPQRRLTKLVRHIARHGEADVYELADMLHVSDATVESDLVKARTLLREHMLVLRRDQHRIVLEGTERRRRRLLRSLLFTSTEGTGLEALTSVRERPRSRLARLHAAIRKALTCAGLNLNEYVLGDLLVHLSVAADRIKSGYPLTDADYVMGDQREIRRGVEGLVTAVREVTGVELGVGEQALLYGLLQTNSRLHGSSNSIEIEPWINELVRNAVHDLSEQFGFSWTESESLKALGLHVQNLIARCRQGHQLENPLGRDFKHAHPLIHELALYFARHVEVGAQIDLTEGEVDFLSFHLGTQFQRQLDTGPVVTITLVTPSYGALPRDLADRISTRFAGECTVDQIVTDLSADLNEVTSDIIVSTVDLAASVRIPVVHISPFLTEQDLTAVRRGVESERDRGRVGRVRSSVISMLDPELFVHQASFASQTEVIEVGAELLHTHGLVERDFAADVMDRERRSSTAFGGRFAIPHSLYLDAFRTGICVLVSDKPVPWGNSHVQLVVMFAIAPSGLAAFRDVLEALIKVLTTPANVEELVECADSFEEFADTLLRLLS